MRQEDLSDHQAVCLQLPARGSGDLAAGWHPAASDAARRLCEWGSAIHACLAPTQAAAAGRDLQTWTWYRQVQASMDLWHGLLAEPCWVSRRHGACMSQSGPGGFMTVIAGHMLPW